jgi:hypothetical protein
MHMLCSLAGMLRRQSVLECYFWTPTASACAPCPPPLQISMTRLLFTRSMTEVAGSRWGPEECSGRNGSAWSAEGSLLTIR